MYQCEGDTLTQDFVVGEDLLESSPTLQEIVFLGFSHTL